MSRLLVRYMARDPGVRLGLISKRAQIEQVFCKPLFDERLPLIATSKSRLQAGRKAPQRLRTSLELRPVNFFRGRDEDFSRKK